MDAQVDVECGREMDLSAICHHGRGRDGSTVEVPAGTWATVQDTPGHPDMQDSYRQVQMSRRFSNNRGIFLRIN